jgi:hypothetical protein
LFIVKDRQAFWRESRISLSVFSLQRIAGLRDIESRERKNAT